MSKDKSVRERFIEYDDPDEDRTNKFSREPAMVLKHHLDNMCEHFPGDSDWVKHKALDIYETILSMDCVEMNNPDWGVSDGNQDGNVLYYIDYGFYFTEVTDELLDFLRKHSCKVSFQPGERIEGHDPIIGNANLKIFIVQAGVEASEGFINNDFNDNDYF